MQRTCCCKIFDGIEKSYYFSNDNYLLYFHYFHEKEILKSELKIFLQIYSQITVPPLARGSGMEFNRITLKFFFDNSCWLLRFVVTVELSCRVVLRCSTTCWFCLCCDLRARWVLCVLCSRYSSDAWNVIQINLLIN